MDWEDSLCDVVFNHWKKKACYLVLILLSIGLVVGNLVKSNAHFDQDYLLIKQIVAKWEQGEPLLEENTLELKKLLKKYPDLSAQYDAFIGQTLLANFSTQEATPFIDRTLSRTGQPYFGDYGRTSLKISKGRYEEALQEAVDLKERVIKDKAFWEKSKEGSVLFAFNLMRIAVLNQQLQRWVEEQKAWQEVKQYGAGKIVSFAEANKSDSFKEIFNHFSAQDTTLLDYIQTREEVLRNVIAVR